MRELMDSIEFTKSQGLGNDFIIINDLSGRLALTPAVVRGLCDRHYGIGADGLMTVRESERADYFMNYYNADGTVAEMCGNGIRVFAKYVHDHLSPATSLRIETLAGVKSVTLDTEGGRVAGVTVDMGSPRFKCEEVPILAEGDEFIDQPVRAGRVDVLGTGVSMGNPHLVVFVDNVEAADVGKIGPVLETAPLFPEKTNVEFVEVVSKTRLRVRVWERGVGETLACGTGACAAAAAADRTGRAKRLVQVELPGGMLDIEWAENGHVMMSGEAEEVFTGRFDAGLWLK